MCTGIVESAIVTGSARGALGWFSVTRANVSYDHPFHMLMEHTLNVDFINEAQGPGARVAVELTADSARELARAILTALERGGSQDAPALEASTQRA